MLKMFSVIWEYPITLMMTMNPDSKDKLTHWHMCISCKCYFIFAKDAHSTIVNKPSSNKDEDKDEEDKEEVFHGNHSHGTQQFTNPSHVLTHSLPMVVAPHTSPVVHANLLQWGPSLVTMSILLSTIWAQEFSPSSGCYNSVFDSSEPIIEWVYELATSGSDIP